VGPEGWNMETSLREALDELRSLWARITPGDQRAAAVLDRIEQLSLLAAYQGFDLEATRRENATLRAALRKRRSRRD
jgi:hypothetical protein